MKRGNHDQKKGAPPIVAKCGACGKGFPSKYAMKNHVCREWVHG